ncbi:MAG: hypothetical protein L6R41_002128 [Letrouitia leprolyta]|nr:MAG: hypothetical protein L6R41_002128 [Letrouitia leprolyta]
MPAKARNQGTDKHFYCLRVTEFNKPAIVYEKFDCTGRACFIPGNGNWKTWASGAQGNCVVIDNANPVNVPPCLAAGQSGRYPPSGQGFPSGVNEWVGGDYGMPQAFVNTQVCNVVPNNAWPGPIPIDQTSPPQGDFNQQYRSNFPPLGDFNPNDYGKRSTPKRHWERTVETRALEARALLTTTEALRRGELRRPSLIQISGTVRGCALLAASQTFYALANQAWWFIGYGGDLFYSTFHWDQAAASQYEFNVDHVLELSMIIQFFSQAFDPAWGITRNQWATVQAFIASNGNRPETAPNGDTWCEVFDQFAQLAGGISNLRGVKERINTMKMEAINAVLPINPIVPAGGWTTRGTVEEARATYQYFQSTSTQARLSAVSLGAALDVLAGSTATQAISNAFARWTTGIWVNAMFQMQSYPGFNP